MQEVDNTFLIEPVFETEGVCPPPKGEMGNFRCALREDNIAVPRQNSFQLVGTTMEELSVTIMTSFCCQLHGFEFLINSKFKCFMHMKLLS